MTACIHHWRIESPNGRTSPGVCLRCGEQREHPNVLPIDIEGLVDRSISSRDRGLAAARRGRARRASSGGLAAALKREYLP